MRILHSHVVKKSLFGYIITNVFFFQENQFCLTTIKKTFFIEGIRKKAELTTKLKSTIGYKFQHVKAQIAFV